MKQIWDIFLKKMEQNQKHLLKKFHPSASVPAPPRIKFKTMMFYQKKHAADIFIETGTYTGDTIERVKNHFRRIISIELDDKLFENAKRRFSSDPQITIYHGDSGELLPELLSAINSPVFFWLDGHFSGDVTAHGKLETPVQKEMQAIMRHPIKNHIILIDDARLFNGTHDYPTISDFENVIDKQHYGFTVKNDIIAIFPK
jgi:hypothetical protein